MWSLALRCFRGVRTSLRERLIARELLFRNEQLEAEYRAQQYDGTETVFYPVSCFCAFYALGAILKGWSVDWSAFPSYSLDKQLIIVTLSFARTIPVIASTVSLLYYRLFRPSESRRLYAAHVTFFTYIVFFLISIGINDYVREKYVNIHPSKAPVGPGWPVMVNLVWLNACPWLRSIERATMILFSWSLSFACVMLGHGGQGDREDQMRLLLGILLPIALSLITSFNTERMQRRNFKTHSRTKSQLTFLVNCGHDIVLLAGLDATCIDASPHADRLLGESSLYGRHLSELIGITTATLSDLFDAALRDEPQNGKSKSTAPILKVKRFGQKESTGCGESKGKEGEEFCHCEVYVKVYSREPLLFLVCLKDVSERFREQVKLSSLVEAVGQQMGAMAWGCDLYQDATDPHKPAAKKRTGEIFLDRVWQTLTGRTGNGKRSPREHHHHFGDGGGASSSPADGEEPDADFIWWTEYFLEPGRTQLRNAFAALFGCRRTPFMLELEYERQDGSIRWFKVGGQEAQNIPGFLWGMIQDTTHDRVRERRKDQEANWMRALVDLHFDGWGVLELQDTSSIVHSSSTLNLFMGGTLMGVPSAVILPRAACRRLSAAGSLKDHLQQVKVPSRGWVTVHLTALTDATDPGLAIVAIRETTSTSSQPTDKKPDDPPPAPLPSPSPFQPTHSARGRTSRPPSFSSESKGARALSDSSPGPPPPPSRPPVVPHVSDGASPIHHHHDNKGKKRAVTLSSHRLALLPERRSAATGSDHSSGTAGSGSSSVRSLPLPQQRKRRSQPTMSFPGSPVVLATISEVCPDDGHNFECYISECGGGSRPAAKVRTPSVASAPLYGGA
ncbi:unnamed protein product [Vitrella brassicaformis CCMP3155]|uniref:PAS domain-containing protein n=1 Tax=Vitrella brassicaformis (strain CCMP3155) TaxID=1169540 RepID=A0A0G4ECW9_VITBC|nr:unnamed protein product [Vitrella brassicaformis CCMP3155]|eukprot:CEL93834.1 unnamed protein product [Vitrella brassicaformis CCMP3155]